MKESRQCDTAITICTFARIFFCIEPLKPELLFSISDNTSFTKFQAKLVGISIE